MGIREGFQSYYKNLGVRGVLAISMYRAFGTPQEISAHPAGIRHPLHLRLGSTDTGVYAGILLGGEYGFDLPFEPEVILDAGANIGLASIYFANKYPKARIFAVEAEARNFAALVKNVQPYPAIAPIHAALWNHDGAISVEAPEPGAGEWAFVTHEGLQRPVRAITVRTLMREMSISKIDLAKIDIEGAERQVFENPDWVEDTRCVMIELHDRIMPGCSEAVEPAMRDFVRTQRRETTVYFRKEDAAPGAETSPAAT